MPEKNKSETDIIDQSVQEILNSNLLNDIFASVALEDEETCQYVLRTITGIKDLRIKYAKGQYRLRNLTSKDTILDIYALDKSGRTLNLELQRFDTVDHPKRTRYYGSMIDKSSLDKGKEYDEMPDVYVIYISETDIWKAGRTIYPINKTLGDTGRPYYNGRHVIYANAEVNDGSKAAEMLQYFKTADPNDMRFGALSKRVRFLKSEKGGYEVMSEVAQRLRQSGIEEGERRGEKRAEKKLKKSLAKKLFDKNNSVEEIADMLEVGEKKVKKWLGLLEA